MARRPDRPTLTLDELRAATPVAASAKPPGERPAAHAEAERAFERFAGRRITALKRPRDPRRIGTTAETRGHRPTWIDVEYLPRTLPHRFRVSPGRQAKLRGFPEGLPIHPLIHESLSFSHPWRTIGKVFSAVGSITNMRARSTGTLVGPNLLLTASHVVPWEGDPWWLKFVPGFRDDTEPFGSSFCSEFTGYSPRDDPFGYDYVICRLFQPLGAQLGWMGSKSFGSESSYYDGTWISNGYPFNFFEGKRTAVEFPVKVEDLDDDDPGKEIETDYHTASGWSGGPLWGWVDGPRVIGVTSGWEYDGYDPRRSVFAGGGALVDLVKFGWSNWQ